MSSMKIEAKMASFSRNTHSLTLMAVHWAGPQTASQDHKVLTIAPLVLTKLWVVTSSKLTL